MTSARRTLLELVRRRRPAPPPASRQVPLSITVNGTRHEVVVDVASSLLTVLRDELRLTGAKEACGRGECGACTVLVDGVATLSCVRLAAEVAGEVTTIEQISLDASDLCEAFAAAGAFQCGFCTPGQVVQGEWLLREGLATDPATVRRLLSGNICRCTGYAGIVAAIVETGRRRGLAAPQGAHS